MDSIEMEMLGGLICLAVSILLGYREYLNWKSIERNDYILKSNSIKKIGGIIIFFIIGISLIYRYFTDFFESI